MSESVRSGEPVPPWPPADLAESAPPLPLPVAVNFVFLAVILLCSAFFLTPRLTERWERIAQQVSSRHGPKAAVTLRERPPMLIVTRLHAGVATLRRWGGLPLAVILGLAAWLTVGPGRAGSDRMQIFVFLVSQAGAAFALALLVLQALFAVVALAQ